MANSAETCEMRVSSRNGTSISSPIISELDFSPRITSSTRKLRFYKEVKDTDSVDVESASLGFSEGKVKFVAPKLVYMCSLQMIPIRIANRNRNENLHEKAKNGICLSLSGMRSDSITK